MFTTTPPINSFCIIYWLKEVVFCQKAISLFVQTLFVFRRRTREAFGQDWRRKLFYHNIFGVSQSRHRMVRFSRSSNKKSFAIKLFQFCDIKTQQRYILQEEVNISRRELTCLVDSLRNFLKTSDEASKCILIPLLKPKVEIGSTLSNDKLFAHYYNDIIEHPNRQIRLSFRFGNNKSCVFSIKKFEIHGNKFFLQSLLTLTIVKFTISARTDITLQTSMK